MMMTINFRHVPRQQRRPTPLGRLEYAQRHDLRRERVVAARRRVERGVRGLDGVELLARLLFRPGRYASSLLELQRFEEARTLLRKTMPVARRVLGDGHILTLKLRCNYARALCADPDATLDEVREAVTTLEDAARIARRVFGSTHPLTVDIEDELRKSQAALRARETPPPPRSA